jgi:hypothetical protein
LKFLVSTGAEGLAIGSTDAASAILAVSMPASGFGTEWLAAKK